MKVFQSMFEKDFLQDVRHNLWEILSGCGRRSELRRPNSDEIYRKVRRADCENDFSNMLWSSQQLHSSPHSQRYMLPASHCGFLFLQKCYFLKHHRASSINCHFHFIPLIFPIPDIGSFHMCTRFLDHQLRTLRTYLGVCRN